MLRTYRGSCHCGAVCLETDLDISAGTVKCNCSICTKMRLWSVRVGPEAFRLILGEAELTGGVHPFERIDVPNMTGAKYLNINVACLDGVDIDELMAAPVTYCDGLNNDWGSRPAEVRHL
ncbi:MAG TPA: GFA family protein [Mesorhizobium sp.]|nr:GFA family protein [Mesorhizobium sp.]